VDPHNSKHNQLFLLQGPRPIAAKNHQIFIGILDNLMSIAIFSFSGIFIMLPVEF